MNLRKLPLRNLRRKPGRTAAQILLVAAMSFFLFAGAFTMSSLRAGMGSLKERLGADIIVVPASAKSKTDLDEILLQGTTGYFYMPADYLDKLSEIQGIDRMSAQIFLASLKAACCSAAVQVIGFDPDADFTVQPWAARKYAKELKPYEVIVGSAVHAEEGESILIYEKNCRVAARLDKTGTGMDTAVYTTFDTIRLLLQSAQELGHDLEISGDPADVISAVYLKTADGYSAEEVANDINLHVRKVEALQTKNMLGNVADGMAGVSTILGVLAAAVWALAFLVILISFAMITRERRQEFASLRVIGVSKRMLAAMLFRETAAVCLTGAAVGILLGCLFLLPFHNLIEYTLKLPFLTPSAGRMALVSLGAAAGAAVTGILACAWTTGRVLRMDTSRILREEN